MDSEYSATGPLGSAPCGMCGRTFNPDVLPRHERICAKTQESSKRRKTFDTAKQRAQGTDLQAFLAHRPPAKTTRPSTAEQRAAKKKDNWRRRHEDFIESIRSAKVYSDAARTGAPLPPPRPSAPNPDYVQCPYCQRRFQEYAAERHIPFCKEQSARLERKPFSSKAKASLSKRIQYKPPLPRKKSGAPEREPSNTNPPGSALVARNSNFSGTYTLNEANRPPVHSRNTSSGGVRVGGGTRQSPGAGAARNLPGNLPSSHRPLPSSGATVVRQTSFSKRAPTLPNPPEISSRIEPSGLHHAAAHPTRTTAPSSSNPRTASNVRGGGEGNIVKSSASRRLYATYEYSSDEQDGAPVVMNGHVETHDAPKRRSGIPGPRVRGRLASNGGSDRSSSPQSEPEPHHHHQPHPPHLPRPNQLERRQGSLRRQHHIGDFPPDPFAHRNVPPPPHNDLPLPVARDYSTDSIGRISSTTSVGSNRGIPLNVHGMPMSKYCYECGTKFPVPQAKYCCECGTKRI